MHGKRTQAVQPLKRSHWLKGNGLVDKKCFDCTSFVNEVINELVATMNVFVTLSTSRHETMKCFFILKYAHNIAFTLQGTLVIPNLNEEIFEAPKVVSFVKYCHK